MTSYLNSLTSHYTSLKRLLPNSLSADSDLHITDPEDSHVSRVLRAYYTEKGRPFPPWLGPDPNAPQQAKAAFVSQPNNYGQFQQQGTASVRNSRGNNAGGLGDLFDTPTNAAPPPREEPLSLRSRRRLQPAAASAPEPQATARPLPSQRLGSLQARGGTSPEPSYSQSSTQSRELSAQARLKARLGGARSNSPGAMSQNSGRSDGYSPDPYARGGSGGASSNAYSTPSSSQNPYGSAPNSSYGGGGKPLTSANAPWASGGDAYGYGGGGAGGANVGGGGGYGAPVNSYGNDAGNSRRAPGLPTNPRRQR